MNRINRGFLRVPRSKRKNEKAKILQEAARLSYEKFEQAAKLVVGVTMKAMLEDMKTVINDREALDRFVREKMEEAEQAIDEGSV